MPEDAGGRSREMIDRGRTRDKIPGRDPSAAPLGTDAEASGMPTAGGFTAGGDALRHHAAQAQKQPKTLPGSVPHPNSGLYQPPSALPWLMVWALIVLGAVGIVVAALEI